MRITYKKVLLVLGLISSLVWLVIFSFPDNRLHLVFCDVGQGDATLITKGFNQILIDGGPNEKVLDCLSKNMPFFDKTIEIVALTHPEADHMTGIIPVMEKYKVNYFLSGPEGNNSAVYAELISSFRLSGAHGGIPLSKLAVVNPYAGERIRLGGITLETLWPTREWMAERVEMENAGVLSFRPNEESGGIPLSKQERGPSPPNRRVGMTENFARDDGYKAVLGAKAIDAHLNDYSLVFLLIYNGKRVLLMGDADTRVQDKILNEIFNDQLSSRFAAIFNLDILKFPHHGSKTGMSKTFLEQIKPKEAVISVGKNSFGHPTEEALDMLKTFNVTVRRTDLEGEIKYTF